MQFLEVVPRWCQVVPRLLSHRNSTAAHDLSQNMVVPRVVSGGDIAHWFE